MSKRKSKHHPEEPDSDETKEHLDQLERRDAEQAEKARKIRQIQEAINAVGNCLNFPMDSGLWEVDKETHSEWRKRCDWNVFSAKWVEEMLSMIPAVEGVASELGVLADHIFEYRPSRPPSDNVPDPTGFMAGLVRRLRSSRSRKKEQVQTEQRLAAVLQRDSGSLDAYALYFRCVEFALGRVAERLIRGDEPLVEVVTYDPPADEHLQVTPNNVLASIENLYQIAEFYSVTVPGVAPEEVDTEKLQRIVAVSREEMRTLLTVLPAAAEKYGISAAPLAELGTRWEQLWKEHGEDKTRLARQFSTYMDGRFLVDTFKETTYRLKLRLIEEIRAEADDDAAAQRTQQQASTKTTSIEVRVASEMELPVLGEQEQVFMDIFLKRSPYQAVTGPKACDEYQKLTGKGIDESDFRKRIVPNLKRWGLDGYPKKGYYFPVAAPARTQYHG